MPDAKQNPGATKIPLPLWARDKNSLAHHVVGNLILNFQKILITGFKFLRPQKGDTRYLTDSVAAEVYFLVYKSPKRYLF